MFDFNKYDDAAQVNRYEGFIDRLGNFYKVSERGKGIINDIGRLRNSHNEWAEHYISEKLNVKDFKFNPTASALFTFSRLSGPAEILVNCFGYVYYSHEPIHYKPIIKIPNPKIANYKVTEEQLDMLYSIMVLNRENTNIDVFFGEEDFDDYKNDFFNVLK